MIDFKQPERRQSQRIKFEESVQLLNASLENGSAFSSLVRSANLSERGLMLIVPKQLKYGTNAFISFKLPGQSGQRIGSEVKVIWSIPSEKEGYFNTGVQFINLEPLKQTAVRTFIYGRLHMSGGENQET